MSRFVVTIAVGDASSRNFPRLWHGDENAAVFDCESCKVLKWIKGHDLRLADLPVPNPLPLDGPSHAPGLKRRHDRQDRDD